MSGDDPGRVSARAPGGAPPEAEALRAALLADGVELEEPIGRGGGATVWGARWRGRSVALKLLAGEHHGRPGRPLAHPAVLEVLGEGRALGRRYLLLPRFPCDLARLLGGAPLRADLRRAVLLPLLDALEHAHRRGVVHGDLKPQNVLVDLEASPPRVALADFGAGGSEPAGGLDASLLSSARDPASGVATLAYLAPERRAGPQGRAGGAPEGPSVGADIYALGVLLFEVLTGRLPLGLELPSELVPGLDRRFDPLLKRALARDPARRPPSAEALRRDLLPLLRPPHARRSGGGAEGRRGTAARAPAPEPEARGEGGALRRVTHRDYLAFVVATGAPRPSTWPAQGRLPPSILERPLAGLSWTEAMAYAAFSGARLPEEAEWARPPADDPSSGPGWDWTATHAQGGLRVARGPLGRLLLRPDARSADLGLSLGWSTRPPGG